MYFYGEDSNLTAIFREQGAGCAGGLWLRLHQRRRLIHELSVADGSITTQSGMSYRVLALDPYSKHMSLPVLRAIHKLVEQGAVVAGEKPTDTPSLADDQAEFKKLNDELFGDRKRRAHGRQGQGVCGTECGGSAEGAERGSGLRLHASRKRYADSVCASQDWPMAISTFSTIAATATRRWMRVSA